MEEEVKKQMRIKNNYLSNLACKDSDAIYLKEYEEDIRPSYFRDIDKIIYSLSFIRYQDKTQVFSYKQHDHISQRMIHILLVSKIARTIARALGLNEDLVEAASLGHDLGHVPFGHVGEAILNKISLDHHEGYFNHNVQSVRNLVFVENYGHGLNISVQVLDAILSHNGEIALGKYEPIQKSKEEFLSEYEKSYQDKLVLLNMKPMTLEGCIVRISDLIAYLGRDIEDAIRLHLIKREDVPKSISDVLGTSTKEIVNTCILDIIENSYQKNYILLSKEVFEAIEELKKFNYMNIYSKSESSKEREELKNKFEVLFKQYLEDIETNNMTSPINSSFLKNMCDEYKEKNTNERIVIDYIAGMTDHYFLKEYERITG